MEVDDEVVVVGPTQFEGAGGGGFTTSRVRAKRYSLGLSEIWAADFPLNPNAQTEDFTPFGRGGVEEGNSILVPGNVGAAAPVEILRGSAVNGTFTTSATLGVQSEDVRGGIAVTDTFDVAMVTSASTVALYGSDLTTQVWETNVLEGLESIS